MVDDGTPSWGELDWLRDPPLQGDPQMGEGALTSRAMSGGAVGPLLCGMMFRCARDRITQRSRLEGPQEVIKQLFAQAGPSKARCQDRAEVFRELQGWSLHPLHGQPVPVLPRQGKAVPDGQREALGFSLCPSPPVLGPHLAPSSLQVRTYLGQVPGAPHRRAAPVL